MCRFLDEYLLLFVCLWWTHWCQKLLGVFGFWIYVSEKIRKKSNSANRVPLMRPVVIIWRKTRGSQTKNIIVFCIPGGTPHPTTSRSPSPHPTKITKFSNIPQFLPRNPFSFKHTSFDKKRLIHSIFSVIVRASPDDRWLKNLIRSFFILLKKLACFLRIIPMYGQNIRFLIRPFPKWMLFLLHVV